VQGRGDRRRLKSGGTFSVEGYRKKGGVERNGREKGNSLFVDLGVRTGEPSKGQKSTNKRLVKVMRGKRMLESSLFERGKFSVGGRQEVKKEKHW